MQIRLSKVVISMGLLGVVLAISTGLLAGKARMSPHQLTIFFTGDDWGKYKYCT